MPQIVFAYSAESTSGDKYVGKCPVHVLDNMFGSIDDHLRDRFGDEYAYLEYVKLAAENVSAETIRYLEKELLLSINRAYELEL